LQEPLQDYSKIGYLYRKTAKNFYMNIVEISAEFAPIIKVGGLADVVHGLSMELVKRGQDVTVILPFFPWIKKKIPHVRNTKKTIVTCEKNQWHNNSIWEVIQDQVHLIFIEDHHPDRYFSRENIYGYQDDIARFLYFSKVAMDFLLNEKKTIDVLHLHDWHTAICPILYKDILQSHNMTVKKIAFTVHNFQHQGKCSQQNLRNIGLDAKKYLNKELLQDESSDDLELLNLLKGAIVYSDVVTTVSKSYAQEVVQKEGAFGLEKVVKDNKGKLFGIVNGLDYEEWNPEKDTHLKGHFSPRNTEKELHEAKLVNKQNLQSELGLAPDSMKPMFISIGRLVWQKGPELIKEAISYIINSGGQFVLCGSSPEKDTQKKFDELKKMYNSNKNIHFHFDYNEPLARKMFAGADFIIIPSKFEPCGLTQLIAMRYATIPIVRKTGGLADTVFDVDDKNVPEKARNGYVFEKDDASELFESLKRAFNDFKNNKTKHIAYKNLELDHSWTEPAKEYLALFALKN